MVRRECWDKKTSHTSGWCVCLALERRHDGLSLVLYPKDQNLRYGGALIAHRMSDIGADVLHFARLQGRLRPVLLFEYEGAFKAINQLVSTWMHVPWQALAGPKFNKENRGLLARQALQVGLIELLGGGCILRRRLGSGRRPNHGPTCKKATGNH